MRFASWCFVCLVGCGASAAQPRVPAVATNGPRAPHSDVRPPPTSGPPTPAAATPALPAPALPAGRADAVSTPTDPALAPAQALYAQLLATPFSPTTPSADARTAIDEVIANIGRASDLAHDVGGACAQIASLGGLPRLQGILLHADALDFVASRIGTLTLPVPLALAASIQQASPAVRADIERQWHERIAAALVRQMTPLYCLAALEYERALAFDRSHPRATGQLAAYGEAFVAGCR